MNLYGDLPTILGEIQEGGWSKPRLDTKDSKPETKAADAAPGKSTASASQRARDKPALAFKPRQASQPQRAPRPGAAPQPVATYGSSSALHVAAQVNNECGDSSLNESDLTDLGVGNGTFDVDDPYDPAKPNDYLVYCEERQQRKRQKKLDEENKKKLEELEFRRREKERERATAIEKGDMKALQSTMSGGRGRGGLSNLPAWMTKGAVTLNTRKSTEDEEQDDDINSKREHSEKQFEDSSKQMVESKYNNDSNISREDSGNVGEKILSRMGYKEGEGLGRENQGITQPLKHVRTQGTNHGKIIKQEREYKNEVIPDSSHFELNSNKRKVESLNTSSCVVLLKNMDDDLNDDECSELAEETSIECEKYGPVIKCLVYIVRDRDCPPEEKVRTFVEFERQDSAVRACRDLDGRFFAGRQISAVFYPENKFRDRNLAPTIDEW